MISVWPKFYPTTEHYKALDAIGGIHRRRSSRGPTSRPTRLHPKPSTATGSAPATPTPSTIPTIRRRARLYWRQISDTPGGPRASTPGGSIPTSPTSTRTCRSRSAHAADGPDRARARARRCSTPIRWSTPTASIRTCIEFKPDVRPFILTRSGFGGIQRAGAALWSGDVVSRWDDLRDQISAGVNFSMSGVPNWTHDIGGFALEERYTKQDPAHLDEWRELNTALVPVRRLLAAVPQPWRGAAARDLRDRAGRHGDVPVDGMVRPAPLPADALHLHARRRHLAYSDGTIMRGLVMDFPADRKAWNVDDQYMFGPAFLVAPVTEFKARAAQRLSAGRDALVRFRQRPQRRGRPDASRRRRRTSACRCSSAPDRSSRPARRSSTPKEGQSGPLTLHVYTGADGSFTLYEDDGVSRQYLNGAFARIPITLRRGDAAR